MTGCRSRTCAINRAGGMRVSEPCSCDPALVAALRERARIVAMLRREASVLLRHDPSAWTVTSDERGRIVAMLRREASVLLRHDAQAVVLGLADRIERGEP